MRSWCNTKRMGEINKKENKCELRHSIRNQRYSVEDVLLEREMIFN